MDFKNYRKINTKVNGEMPRDLQLDDVTYFENYHCSNKMFIAITLLVFSRFFPIRPFCLPASELEKLKKIKILWRSPYMS